MKSSSYASSINKQSSPYVAILTGDIVRSSSLPKTRRFDLFHSLQVLSGLIRQQYPDNVRYALSKFRGDGWQLLVDPPQKCFEISLFIRTYIRTTFKTEKLDTRIAIAIGSVEFVPETNISEGFGIAFTESGKMLDQLKNYRLGITLATKNGTRYTRLLDTLLKSYDTFITSWTALQCQAVHFSLQGLTQAEIGKKWQPKPIDQTTVNKHLAAANWNVIKEGLSIFETEITRILEEG